VADSGKFVLGHPKKGGRKKGVPNKVTAEIKEAAQAYGAAAIEAAVASNDRGYGKPGQAIAGPGGGPVPVILYSDDEGL